MPCSYCDKPKIFAGGLCSGCYTRQKRNGTLARKNVVNTGRCSHPGCSRVAFSKGLCGLHYQRAQHPLNSMWRTLRQRSPGEYPVAWDRFEAFLRAVGERPTPLHQFRRLDKMKPWGPGNMVWREPIGVGYTENAREYAWRWHLRKKYDLTVEDVAAMAEAQGGKCANCPRKLDGIDPSTEKPLKTCIDHDHLTDAVRGILCDYCNKALGLLDDDPARLVASVIYLSKHAGDPAIIDAAVTALSAARAAIHFPEEL